MQHGLYRVYFHTQQSGTVDVDESFWGSTKADIKGLTGSQVIVSGNDVPMYSYTNPEKPTIAWSVNSLGMKYIAELTGLQSEDDDFFSPSGNLPKVGLVIVTRLAGQDDMVRVYAFPNCHGTYSTVSLATDTDSKRSMVVDQLNFNALYDKGIDNTYIWGDMKKTDLDKVWTKLGWDKPQEELGDHVDNSTKTPTSGAGTDHQA